jgi:hypothetical protein
MSQYPGYSSTVTSGGTLTLTSASENIQYFTGTNTHTITLPNVSTLTIGRTYIIMNLSTQYISVQTSGLNAICKLQTYNTLRARCKLNTGTDLLSWTFCGNNNREDDLTYFSAYNDGVTNTDIDIGWTDVKWDATDIIDSNIVYNNETSNIMVNSSGDYKIYVDINLFVVSGTGSARTPIELRLLKNGTYLAGTKVLAAVQDVGMGTSLTLKTIKTLEANDVIKVQCTKQSSNRVVRLYPDGCRIVIEKLSK